MKEKKLPKKAVSVLNHWVPTLDHRLTQTLCVLKHITYLTTSCKQTKKAAHGYHSSSPKSCTYAPHPALFLTHNMMLTEAPVRNFRLVSVLVNPWDVISNQTTPSALFFFILFFIIKLIAYFESSLQKMSFQSESETQLKTPPLCDRIEPNLELGKLSLTTTWEELYRGLEKHSLSVLFSVLLFG